jgi:pyruvate,water dikinase
MTDLTLAPPAFYPTPDHFPVVWQNPGDARLTWSLNRMHWPAPVTPLTGDFIALFLNSARRVTWRFGQPKHTRCLRVNTYIYLAQEALDLSPAEFEAVAPQAEAFIAAALPEFGRGWQERWLPEIHASLDYWENFDLPGAAVDQLLAHLDETLARVDALSEIHHHITFLAEISTSLFCDLYGDLFAQNAPSGAGENLDAFELLQGSDQSTLRMSRDLWALSRLAQDIPAVQAALAEQLPETALTVLGQTPAAAPFLQELQACLNAHGWRSSGQPFELEAPAWRENPAGVIGVLQEYLGLPDRHPRAQLDKQAARREKLQAEVLGRLAKFPPAVGEQFELLLKAAQTGVWISEEHHYWLDCFLTYQTRRVALAFGERLARAGTLTCPEDVFYLTFAEIRQAAGATGRGEPAWQNMISGRRAEMAYFRTVTPPPALGSGPAAGPAADPAGDPPAAFSRADERFWGAPPPAAANPRELRGNPGAAGLARGPARVIRGLQESGALQRGEILVVEMTSPAWARLFNLAAGVVTDTGGVLCHTATVAREFGIPAVVGTQTGTQVIRTGQMLEVNGAEGLVRLLPDD